ncbi:hypothetical protein [Streptomyces sp. NPDC048269]|uniref:hypothetical protein n=1 Tax=Streptomyces sp. NPDC048269 TaxID=3155753 RepID=UPI00342005C5
MAGQWAEAIVGFGLKGQPFLMRAVPHPELADIRFHVGDLPTALAAGEAALGLLPNPHPYSPFVAAAAIAPLIENGQLAAAHGIADDRRFRNSPESGCAPTSWRHGPNSAPLRTRSSQRCTIWRSAAASWLSTVATIPDTLTGGPGPPC